MRKLLSLLVVSILLLMPALAIEECQRVTTQANVPCKIISTWNGTPNGCTDYNITFFNETPIGIENKTWQTFHPFCQVTFNLTNLGTYHYSSSLEEGVITVVADLSFGGSVLFFFFVINIAIFIIPYFVRFVESEIWNKFIGKMVWILGLMVLSLNTTLAADLADSAALGVNDIIFTYLWFFVKGIYIAMIVVLFQAVLAALKEWGAENKTRRMGG